MGRWKEGAREFTVKVSYVEGRGFQLYVPHPIMIQWESPGHLTFRMHGDRATVVPVKGDGRAKRKRGRAETTASA